MTELLTAAQMRAIEQAAIESGEVTGLELMERAGRGVVDAVLEWRPELATAPHRAVILCGPGNNGGDGFVVAGLLHGRGWQVEVFLYGDETKLPPDAAENARRWREMGEVRSLDYNGVRFTTPDPDLYVDALFGTGLTRAVSGELAELVRHIAGENGDIAHYLPRMVAVDAPSGLCLDSGRTLGMCPRASLTVTFDSPKVGHFAGAGPWHCGRLKIVDIGLATFRALTWSRHDEERDGPPRVVRPAMAWLAGPAPQVDDLRDHHRRFWALLDKNDSNAVDDGHKYDHGHALILSGGPGKAGAARLAALSALRVGAGLVTLGCPPGALQENAARLDAIMLASLTTAESLEAEIEARKIKAVCIGPGFGTGERLRQFLSHLLSSKRPTVLDADALTEYRDDPETLFRMLHEGCVLTPHEGEFGRLFPDILAKLREPAAKGPAYSKVDATREAAKRAGCVVLFKGADTVIAEPDGHCAINSAHYERSAPWLATAGSGDVLAGFITGLLARGFAPMQAAETAAWLHVECALKFGPGLIAEDLPEQLPAVFRDLGL